MLCFNGQLQGRHRGKHCIISSMGLLDERKIYTRLRVFHHWDYLTWTFCGHKWNYHYVVFHFMNVKFQNIPNFLRCGGHKVKAKGFETL